MTILTTPEVIAFVVAGVLLAASGFALGRLSK